MEHAALHAFLLSGLILSLGGPLAAWLLRSVHAPVSYFEHVGQTTAIGAWLGVGATLADLVVQVAEVQGQTIFGGFDLALIAQFATETTVGQLSLGRAALLVVTAFLAWKPRGRWLLVGATAFGAIFLTGLVSHAAAQPERRALAIAAQVLHLAAAAGWMGVLLQLFRLDQMVRIDQFAGRIVRRFSPLALFSSATIFVTGLLAVLRSLHSPIGLLGSAYGLTLLIKLVLIVPAVIAGLINFRFIGPALDRVPSTMPRFRRMLELEIIAGLFVITVAGILGSISPPGEAGAYCLTEQQAAAVLTPDFPTSHVDDWTAPDNPIAPTDDELRYSEMTHNWSGVLVIVLGLLWLAQGRAGALHDWAARLTALALVPFGVFIAVVSNPEVWLLRRVGFWEVLGNPILLEHQLGAMFVFILAWLAWRDTRRPEHLRPLGYALPVVMIAGSLLLLGHAHATVNVPDGLSNLINVQHAIMGACGLFGGIVRLLQLRGLIPARAGAIAWPLCVVALGIFMAFFYRELTQARYNGGALNPNIISSNPLREGLSSRPMPQPCNVVIFGASGDLTFRKLIPALYNLAADGDLPAATNIMGFARREKTDDSWRTELKETTAKGSRSGLNEDIWNNLAPRIFYHQSEFGNAEGYRTLAKRLEELDAKSGTRGNRLFYLSVSPTDYEGILTQLAAAGLNDTASGAWTRVIVEKPFGTDLASAHELNEVVARVFREKDTYRIDHYLGKETAQNIMVLRFANGIFEPLWNHRYIDHVQITAAEPLGVEQRGPYYEASGALRDMVQNHLLQLLCLTAMEPPTDLAADSIRDEKVKVVRSLRRMTPEDVGQNVVRGQYAAGAIAGKEVKAYREEDRVSPKSNTETYAALKVNVDNWRWAGVPFYIRVGKRLAKGGTEIAIQFKHVPNVLFSKPGEPLGPNVLVIRIQPDEGISLRMQCKIPGNAIRIEPVKMDFRYGTSFGKASPEAYERLLLDAMSGDATLFARRDEVEGAWRFIDAIEDAWHKSETPPPLCTYPSGSWGPKEADELLEREGHAWRRM